ncbi:hypothetical protein MNL01_07370 [Bartonella krasnovii]|uniref:Uncharacterized protein n=1 Tax=Bartonella krasnovii TaxID=2267275 RepID=A0A5B9D2Q2_9HYPH|nr:hypothetical protein [Bartonella krasnovii]QEE12742.1 hypothetical protein D1092_07255 [Bartonella krasnovii]UNF41933.1 hypothetical protein MNL08_07145 [Bartonella krasnovii]UNF53447.1 hypothetical protein MNL01_07370 [Bartonella krasnovii]UNF55138.1 hypothetical protein MNL00_07155 [Bartonella krasnovii]
MKKDQSQQKPAREGTAFISQSMLEQSAAFKKGMVLSTKDYVIICCLAILLLVLFAISLFMKPWEFFQISKEQLQAMKYQDFQEMIQESLLQPFQNNPAIEFLRHVGWNSVWAFLCFVPQIILGVLLVCFPLFSIFLAIFKRDVKEMMQLWETLPKQQQPDAILSTECNREGK